MCRGWTGRRRRSSPTSPCGAAISQVGRVAYPPDHPDPDGSAFLLSAFDGRPETYQSWATDYCERPVELAAINHVYRHKPLTPEVVSRLNPATSLCELAVDIREIGYPT